jgi:gamma-tubulin complex component 5
MEAAEIRPTTEDEFDSDDDDDDMGHEHTLTISFHDSTYHQQLRKVKVQFDHLATSVADGLKGIARADGLPSWDILAERLEWCRR